MISRITLNLKREVVTDPTSEADTYLHPRTVETHLFVNYDERLGTIPKRSASVKGASRVSQTSSVWRSADIPFIDTSLERQGCHTRPLSCAAEGSIGERAEVDDPSYPPTAYAVLSERDVYELRALRASAVHRV